MSRRVVIRFADRAKTDQAIAALRRLHSGHAVKFQASALVAKDESGKRSVEQITREGHGGIAAGALIGGIAGLPAGPAAAAIMATGGAVIGNAADLTAEQDFAAGGLRLRGIPHFARNDARMEFSCRCAGSKLPAGWFDATPSFY